MKPVWKKKKNTHAGVENSKSRHQVGTKALFELDFIQVYSIQRGKDHLDRKLTAFPASLDDKSYLSTRVSKRDNFKIRMPGLPVLGPFHCPNRRKFTAIPILWRSTTRPMASNISVLKESETSATFGLTHLHNHED